jgi:peptide/nickel transport system substrate-binding protein
MEVPVMFKKNGLFVGFLAIVMIVSLISLTTYAAGEKDTLIIGIQDNTASLDPAKCYEIVGMGMIQKTYETLVMLKEDDVTQPIPKLAESWEVQADGKTWIFHLRKDVKFSTGNPVNADAVVFSLQRAIKLAQDVSWLLTQFGMTEESITKIDDYTVQIVLDKQYASGIVLSCLSTPVASILDPAVMDHEQNGDMGSAWLENHSVGSGPFVFEQVTLGESYLLTENEYYWGEKPSFKQIVVKNVREPFEQAIMLEKGEIDIAWNLLPDQVKRLEGNPEVQTYQVPTLTIVYFRMNLAYAPLAKSGVRDAIRYAIDYESMVDLILQGAAQKIQTIIPKGLVGYNPSMPYSQDIEKAKQLMAEAGYADGFEAEFVCPEGSPWVDVATGITADLAKIGINIKVIPSTGEQLQEIDSARGGQLAMWDWLPDYADPDNNAKGFAHSDSAGDDATVQLLAWMSHYVNPEIAKLADQAAFESDAEKRKELYQQITETILDDGPFAILYTPVKQYGVRLEVLDYVGVQSILAWFPSLK